MLYFVNIQILIVVHDTINTLQIHIILIECLQNRRLAIKNGSRVINIISNKKSMHRAKIISKFIHLQDFHSQTAKPILRCQISEINVEVQWFRNSFEAVFFPYIVSNKQLRNIKVIKCLFVSSDQCKRTVPQI